MALSIKDLVEPINRLLDHAQKGAKLPADIRDDNAARTLKMIVDLILPAAEEQDDEDGDGFDFPMLKGDVMPAELSARMRPRSGQPTAKELAAAKDFMLHGPKPRKSIKR